MKKPVKVFKTASGYERVISILEKRIEELEGNPFNYDELNSVIAKNKMLKDQVTHYRSERAELTTALIEVLNIKDLDLAKSIAREAIKHVHSFEGSVLQ